MANKEEVAKGEVSSSSITLDMGTLVKVSKKLGTIYRDPKFAKIPKELEMLITETGLVSDETVQDCGGDLGTVIVIVLVAPPPAPPHTTHTINTL